MNADEQAAVDDCRIEIVDAIVPHSAEELLSHLTNDTKPRVLNPDSADFLKNIKKITRETVYHTLSILKVNDHGWYGLTSFLTKHNNAGLVAKLKKMAGKPTEDGQVGTKLKLESAPAGTTLKLESAPIAAANDRYDNSRKGLAMIINVDDFDDSRVRHGSDKDFHSSQDLWQNKLGYNVVTHYNSTAKEIENAMKRFAKNPRHKDADSAIVVVMSHGNLEQIEGSDGVGVSIEQFVNTLCKSELLKGKPKLFIFQACRDILASYDGAEAKEVEITEETIQSSLAWFKESKSHHDGVEDVSHADSLLAFATTRGQPACRRSDGTGSYYIQEICNVFASQFETVHVAKMLETVELNVSKMPIRLATGPFEQVGTNINNLRRPLYL